MSIFETVTASDGRRLYFLHEDVSSLIQKRISEDEVGRDTASRNGEAVERNIPTELLPEYGFQRGLGLAIHPSCGKGMHTGFDGWIDRARGGGHADVAS